MQPSNDPIITIRDFIEEDMIAQDEYFKKASDEFLFKMGVNAAAIRNVAPPSRVRPILATPVKERSIHVFTIEINGICSGVFVIKKIQFGKQADLHMHIFNIDNRRKGYGSKIFWTVVAKVFDVFDVKIIICEPSATNPAPNALLQKLGLKVVAQVVTPADGILIEHLANRYEITRDFFESKIKQH